VYTVCLPLAALVIATGIDPLKLTVFSMALTALSLPITVVPLLVLMNDPMYLGERTNGWVSNAAVLAVGLVACVVALVAIPLQLLGS
jgi:Mn2+/Fe2+ NRAMP family transporter